MSDRSTKILQEPKVKSSFLHVTNQKPERYRINAKLYLRERSILWTDIPEELMSRKRFEQDQDQDHQFVQKT